MIKTIDAYVLKCDGCSKEYPDIWLNEKQAKKEAEDAGWFIAKGIELCPICREKMEEN